MEGFGKIVTDSSKKLCEMLKIDHPLFCGAMYPCSNPELVAAASEAGGIGVVQPLSLTYVHGYEMREGLQKIKSLTSRPIAFNALIEASSKIYLDRMKKWIDIALDEGVRVFVTALGKPDWVVEKVHAYGGIVIHDVTNLKWAQIAKNSGVDALIAVNDSAGGHLGEMSAEKLFNDLKALNLPLIAAGGVSSRERYLEILSYGYAGVQMGTAFIATTECTAHQDYKDKIVEAKAKDIVATEKISGVPVSVIRTKHVDKLGLKASGLEKFLLQNRKTKHWVRLYYTMKSLKSFKKSNSKGSRYLDFYQAGKSVEGISSIQDVSELVRSIV